ncbi:MAG TPA: DMT family transporter [Chloroflexota bacterium]|nr:DMT family transporter [Chloroflexota bacterium]
MATPGEGALTTVAASPLPASAGRRWSVGRTICAFGALVLIWGLAFVVFKVSLREVPALDFTALRAAVGGLGLAAFLIAAGRPFPSDRASNVTALLLGACNVVAFWGFQSLSLQRISPGEAAILVYLQPLFVALGAWFFLGEAFSSTKVVGLFLGFGGVVVIVGGQGIASGGQQWLGYLLGVGAGLGWACGTVAFKWRGVRGDVLWISALQCLYGAIPLVLLAALTEGWRVPFDFTTVWTILYAGLGASALSYILWFSLLRQRAASQVSAFVFLVPLVAVLSDAAILGSSFGPLVLLGGAAIVAGIWLVNVTPARQSL